jgi:hypothetical protein
VFEEGGTVKTGDTSLEAKDKECDSIYTIEALNFSKRIFPKCRLFSELLAGRVLGLPWQGQ